MPRECTAGKVRLDADEVLSLVAGHELWPQLMPEIVTDRALRTIDCTPEETESYFRDQIASNGRFLENRKERLLREGVAAQDVDFYLVRPLLLEKFKENQFGPKVEQTFLDMKTGMDSLVFSMIRHRDHELIRELYFRIRTGEEEFEAIAAKYSEGRESSSGGLVGPIAFRQLNPVLAGVLVSAECGIVKPPFVIDGSGVIVRLKEKIPARLDLEMRRQLIETLFQEWVKREVQSLFF